MYISLRAQFGSDTMKNAVHGSSTVEKAEEAIKEFFPEVEILPDGTVRGLSLVHILCIFVFSRLFYLWGTKNATIHLHDHSAFCSDFFNLNVLEILLHSKISIELLIMTPTKVFNLDILFEWLI